MGQHRGPNRQEIVVADGTIGSITDHPEISDELPREREDQDHQESEEPRKQKKRRNAMYRQIL